MLRLASRHETDDVVIDLTERLAPYDGAVFRPRARAAPQPPANVETPLWQPLDLEHLHPAADPSLSAPAEEAVELEVAPEAAAQARAVEPQSAPRVTVPKQPRNEPCACGSGQKFKRCCGRP